VKKLTYFLAAVLSFVMCLGGLSPALAQQLPEPASRGTTTFYFTPEQQKQGVQVFKQLGYDVAIPNPDLSAMLPENLSDFPAVYQQVLVDSRKKNGTNGSFTEGWFDFQLATAGTPGTNKLFTITAPLNGRLYSVVAGLPSSQCPLKIQSTVVAFFDDEAKAAEEAGELDKVGYLVYVSPVDQLTIKAFSQLFYDQTTGKKKTNPDCFLVSGATENVKVDFREIFYLLPPSLQQPAKQQPFEYDPKVGNFIYLVNARKTLTAQGGNEIIDRPDVDKATNIYTVDTNNSINVDGNLTSWQIWAKNTLPVQLIIYRVDTSKPCPRSRKFWCLSVVGKSEVKTPVVGKNSFALPTPIKVKKGDFVGLYNPQAGSVAFTLNGLSNLGQNNFTGTALQTIDAQTIDAQTIDACGVDCVTNFAFSSNRVYSVFVKGPAL